MEYDKGNAAPDWLRKTGKGWTEMKNGFQKTLLIGLACGVAVALSGCYFGYGSYYSSYSSSVKTTASPETVQELDLTSLQADDGTYRFADLPWGSTYTDLETLLDTSIGTTTAFTDGETLGDLNYSYRILDYITVGLQPLYDADGGLSCITFYFETTYTSEQMDQIYDDIKEALRELYGEEDKEEASSQTSGSLTYETVTTFWFHEVSEHEMTSLQLGKLDSGSGTTAVVLGANIYDPTLDEEETSEEGAESQASEAESTAAEGTETSGEAASAQESTEE